MFLGFKGFLCRKYTNWILVIQTGGGKSSGGRDPGPRPESFQALETLCSGAPDGGWKKDVGQLFFLQAPDVQPLGLLGGPGRGSFQALGT